MSSDEQWELGFCPCCGYRAAETGPEYEAGSHGICPLCRWEDDRPPSADLPPGPNPATLAEARENFREFGWAYPEPKDDSRARAPTAEDERDPEWPPD